MSVAYKYGGEEHFDIKKLRNQTPKYRAEIEFNYSFQYLERLGEVCLHFYIHLIICIAQHKLEVFMDPSDIVNYKAMPVYLD